MKKTIVPVFISFCVIAAFSCNDATKPAEEPTPDTTTSNLPAPAPAVAALPSDSTGLTEKYWKLTEINGKPVKPDSTFMKEPHVIFKTAENQVNGNGGCNGFGGQYELKSPNRIKVGNLISTQMACPALDIENQFTKALEAADNYFVIGDTLVLNKAKMAPLARFVRVTMQ
ncbi:MAG: META domain-containing protein [Pseudobacter sp.]|uniref:META domain-containing protein n=1 Tax=Pseudobacter sp. TaxID=2045420 RepID=UPI003F7CF21D